MSVKTEVDTGGGVSSASVLKQFLKGYGLSLNLEHTNLAEMTGYWPSEISLLSFPPT